jgi:hypothetical protein
MKATAFPYFGGGTIQEFTPGFVLLFHIQEGLSVDPGWIL